MFDALPALVACGRPPLGLHPGHPLLERGLVAVNESAAAATFVALLEPLVVEVVDGELSVPAHGSVWKSAGVRSFISEYSVWSPRYPMSPHAPVAQRRSSRWYAPSASRIRPRWSSCTPPLTPASGPRFSYDGACSRANPTAALALKVSNCAHSLHAARQHKVGVEHHHPREGLGSSHGSSGFHM